MRSVFQSDRFYDQRAIAHTVDRSTRTIRNWRTRGLIPAPDTLLGGRDPAWSGTTLNDAPAFASTKAE